MLAQASADGQARPHTTPDPDLKVRTALDRAAAGIEGKFVTQPVVEASIRQTIGNTYQQLGLYPEAERELTRVIDLRLRFLGGGHRDTLDAMNDLAVLDRYQGKYLQAERLYGKVLDKHRRMLGTAHPDTLAVMNNLAMVYRYEGKYAQAELLYTKVLEERRRVLGGGHTDTLTTMNGLAVLYVMKGSIRKPSLSTRKTWIRIVIPLARSIPIRSPT